MGNTGVKHSHHRGIPLQRNIECSVPLCTKHCYANFLCREHDVMRREDKLIIGVFIKQVCWCGEPVKRAYNNNEYIVCSQHLICIEEGCEEPQKSIKYGMCLKHERMRWLNLDPANREAQNTASRNYVRPDDLGPVKPKKEIVGYFQMHKRVKHYFGGPASEFDCVDCGEQAGHFSMNLDSPIIYRQELNRRYFDGSPVVVYYSIDESDYVPRCVKDHRAYDKDAKYTGEVREYSK